jgi:hypothetical protein
MRQAVRHTLRNTAIGIAAFAGMVIAGNTLIKPALVGLGWMDDASMPRQIRLEDVPAGITELPRQGGTPRHINLNLPARPALTYTPPAARLVDTPAAALQYGSANGLRTTLLIDGAARPVDGHTTVALPDGARFRLQLRSSEPAVIEVHAVNPHGEASDGPLWRGTVPANTNIDTARLRLAGTHGMETLRVLRRSLLDGSVSEQRVQLLHD